MLTLKQLRALVEAQPRANDDLEVKVWLPGSTISLEFGGGKMMGMVGARRPHQFRDSNKIGPGDVLLIEGNLDEGSALC